MFRLNLKIALRNLWKNKVYTAINIGGLAIALSAFILVAIYVRFETSFDHNVPNHENIYLLGRTLPDRKTNYTSLSLAQALKEAIPEIENVGRSKKTNFEFAFSTPDGRVYGKDVITIDYTLAKMFHIKPEGGLVKPEGEALNVYLPQEFITAMFPKKTPVFPAKVSIGPLEVKQYADVSGIVNHNVAHSNLVFDALLITADVGKNQEPTAYNYFTYIQVKPGTDMAQLQKKVAAVYKEELKKSAVTAVVNRGSVESKIANEVNLVTNTNKADQSGVFLDPLDNLHLRPIAGNNTNYKVVMALSALTVLVMVIACINFTNLTIAQTNKRAKEVGVKKVLGAYRLSLVFQFLIEILMQCLVALILAIILAEISLPLFNDAFSVSFSLWKDNYELVWQLPIVLLIITLISGIYPALILSGFRPVAVLKGNLQTSYKTLWLRNALLVTQFTVAIVFMAGLLIVSSQLKYMRTEDTGFKAGQVVYIKNIVMFGRPYFENLKARILEMPGVNSFTVASDIPDGSRPGRVDYAMEGKDLGMDIVHVDFDYFETLRLNLKDGRFFSKTYPADAENGIVLNEAAVAAYGVKNPVGKIIRGCDMDYRIVGVVKDAKMQGFETAVEPTVYAIKSDCANDKMKFMVNVDPDHMAGVLAALKSNWKDLNKMDGDDFRYEFMDELYGRLFKKQEQLQAVFYGAAILTIFIATLGLFAFSAFTITSRMKEISIRKVLGASDFNILSLLNSFFIRIVLIANLIGWPIAYIAAQRWLETFAYRIDLPILPFFIAGSISIILTLLTVSFQARNAVKTNPVDALKYE
ncbi:ABC transporter permease [Pedobacter gandavensis]|uniref:FtsX-like permease family protein n=1 Tax=Pedobacter gandavensis TaxID=2679963 RepID=A0ABR6EVC8_9SPHI|nr:ABC transporter permease [Pedobacter gandavensis]MBB2149215.1 FtsX-like permease family protein [Pedobacter gandavensis]